MAWSAFQKSNWTRSVGSQKAIQYFPAASNGTATGNLTFTAGLIKAITLTAAFSFKGNGMVEAWDPMGAGSGFATAVAAGVAIESAYLTGPAAGSYAAGNHPLIIVELSSGAAYTTAATGFDLICMQS